MAMTALGGREKDKKSLKQNPKNNKARIRSDHQNHLQVNPNELHQMHKEHRASRKSKKEPKQHKYHKRAEQKFGVSLSSITGFEKPMLPPTIIDFSRPINYNQAPEGEILQLDLPTNINMNATSTALIIPAQQVGEPLNN